MFHLRWRFIGRLAHGTGPLVSTGGYVLRRRRTRGAGFAAGGFRRWIVLFGGGGRTGCPGLSLLRGRPLCDRYWLYRLYRLGGLGGLSGFRGRRGSTGRATFGFGRRSWLRDFHDNGERCLWLVQGTLRTASFLGNWLHFNIYIYFYSYGRVTTIWKWTG